MLCTYCKHEKGNAWIGTGNGAAHMECWFRNHPYEPKHSFEKVLTNGDDQVLVRQLLIQHLTPHTKEFITDEFNRIMEERYQKRIGSFEGKSRL